MIALDRFRAFVCNSTGGKDVEDVIDLLFRMRLLSPFVVVRCVILKRLLGVIDLRGQQRVSTIVEKV